MNMAKKIRVPQNAVNFVPKRGTVVNISKRNVLKGLLVSCLVS